MNRRPIRKLEPDTAAKIAAGEVIDRPVAALKELVENALDAGARQVEIRVRGGLDEEFEVRDDGAGIARDQLLLAFEPHATSKIDRIEDLGRLETLGFRGEALPSIARASKLTIESRAEGEEEGSSLVLDGGAPSAIRPTGRAGGTSVQVRELFFNLPARKKFLRTRVGELRAASRMLSAYALAYPEVGFQFHVDGRERLHAPSAASLRDRVGAVLGQRFLEQCLGIEEERPGLCLTGFLGVPELARLNREAQVFLLNRRWIQSPLLSQAVRHAYGNLIPPARHPACVIDLRIDPASLDVNVHPTKREVRFAHEDKVFSFLSKSASAPLSRLVPRYEPLGKRSPDEPPALQELVRDRGPQMPLWERGGSRVPIAQPSAPPRGRPSETVGPAETRTEDVPSFGEQARAGAEPSEEREEDAGAPPKLANLWQLHDTYLLAPVHGGLVIIDQHAAHERILYEESLTRLSTSSGASQQLLFPKLLDLTRSEFDWVVEIQDPLQRLGFDLAPIGPPTILIRGVPTGLGDRDPGELLRDILDGIGESSGRTLPEDELGDRLAKSFACHSAVRAGQRLTLEEMNQLVDRLFATELPHGDPHGRPTFVRIDLAELHSRFGRSAPRP